MNSRKLMDTIVLLKKDNQTWLAHANALIHGDKITKDAIPTYHDSCQPCQWLYCHSDEVNCLCQNSNCIEVSFVPFDMVEEIEILRYDFHEKYLTLFKCYFSELSDIIGYTLFGTMPSPSFNGPKCAQTLYYELLEIHQSITSKLVFLETSVPKVYHLKSA